MAQAPADVQLVGDFVALRWPDGREDFLHAEDLRACSPSAENLGERDILGNLHGGTGPRRIPGVKVVGWHYVGGYALSFTFSDGHRTGIYSFTYLRELGQALAARDDQAD